MSGGVITAGWIQAAPTMVLAVSAFYGLANWRKQILEQRRIERAEACLIAADDVTKAVRAIRSTVFLSQDDVDAAGSLDEATRQFEVQAVQRALDALEVFHHEYRRASFFMDMPVPGTDQELDECMHTIVTPFRLMRFWERQSSPSNPHAREQAAKFRGEFLGLPAEDIDPREPISPETTEQRIRTALNALEDKLLPVTGGKRKPRS